METKKIIYTDNQIKLRNLAADACDCYDRYLEGGYGSGSSYRGFEYSCKKISELSGVALEDVRDAISNLDKGFTYEVPFDRLRSIGVDLGEKPTRCISSK